MWANHAEVSKNTLTEAADLIDAMVVELCRVQREASGINAELTSVQSGDKTHAIRDSLLAGSRLSRLQDDIRGFLVARGA